MFWNHYSNNICAKENFWKISNCKIIGTQKLPIILHSTLWNIANVENINNFETSSLFLFNIQKNGMKNYWKISNYKTYGIVLTFTHCFICTVTEIRILVMRGCFEVTRVENESFASLERPLGLERLAMFIFHPSDLKTTSNTRIHFRHSTNETMSGGQYFF